jgi:hypothetical protein
VPPVAPKIVSFIGHSSVAGLSARTIQDPTESAQ